MAPLLFDSNAKALILPLEGCHNFRAVAGWRSSGGKALVSGRLFRSGGLDQLTNADHTRISALDIRQVFDLRSSAEIGRAPSRWPLEHVPQSWSGAESAAEADLTAVMQRTDVAAHSYHEAMLGVYARFPDDLAPAVGALGESILSREAGATLIHCTAGKDRTGFVVAMLLHAIGLRNEDIMADYLLSNASYDAAFAKFNGDGRLDAVEERAPGAIAMLVGVHPEYLQAAVESAISHFGSLNTWFEKRAGLDGKQRKRLSELLLG